MYGLFEVVYVDVRWIRLRRKNKYSELRSIKSVKKKFYIIFFIRLAILNKVFGHSPMDRLEQLDLGKSEENIRLRFRTNCRQKNESNGINSD